ncbi:MAG: ABC transporter permease [Clostridium sp.]|uniref:ABC transporter permease n=1 Tax=Anaeromassilibacillus senegalensis TaxID=1673717 RepID=A0ABS9MJV4_9FIRM|nr:MULTISPECIES: ABC transporter permease [Anaeromassilibacillus]MBS5623055.1 ABC transporter permease [Clostridium sp.]MCG4610739.1 ABC transporter permease [Anaeromassilibacillus senegalensis]OUO75910.1 peptide ABC transporter permease [Anaeromassilibacillus sp. An250]HJB50892.1 ABC transporter permease [Candidatus Anaeromassilibacillus stercoravium]
MKKNPLSLQLDPDDFLPASEDEKKQLDIMRESTTFWKDALKRFSKNKVAMVAAVVILLVIICAFVVPNFYPYEYDQQIRGSENLWPMQYSEEEQALIDSGESVFPHIFGTDKLGRDLGIRVLTGARVSLLVGLIASALVLLIGSIYGSVAGYFGGKVDLIMMRIVDIIYSIPDILIIILLQVTLKSPLQALFDSSPIFDGLNRVGVGLISIFITFSLLYWVSMARIVRSQVMTLKEQEFVTAAKALGASNGRIIRKHLLPNCIGTLIVTATLQIPSAIFTEAFLSFLGLGVAAPMASLGSLASDAISSINSFPYRLFIPAVAISIIILAFNLFGDGLRDAFDPKLKK